MASELTSQVLEALSKSDERVKSADAFPSIPSTTVKSALDRLLSRDMVSYRTIDREEAILTTEAEGIAEEGSHEAKVFEAVRRSLAGLKIAELPVCWLNCTPARLDFASPWLADKILECCGQRNCKDWTGQGFQRGMDQKGRGHFEAQREAFWVGLITTYMAMLNAIR